MTLLPQVRDQLDEAARRRAHVRGARRLAGVPRLRVRDRPSFPASTDNRTATRTHRPRSTTHGVAWVVVALVPVAVLVGALMLLRGSPKPTSTTKPTGPTTIQQLVDILAVLRRPQTTADRMIPDQILGGTPVSEVNVGTPDLPLARLATITPWGQRVFIAPMKPLTTSQLAQLKHRYPGLGPVLRRPARTVSLGLFGANDASFASVADIEAGHESIFEGRNSILGLAGPGPPIRVVILIPDGVANIELVLPRQAYPGAIAYPAPERITVPVHDNIAAFETDRYIDQDHWSRIGMIWYAPSGAVLKRTGSFEQFNSVVPDPTLSSPVRKKNPSSWDSVTVIPATGSGSTTFTVAFRRPVSGAYRYAFRFSGPTARSSCSSPVNQTPIIRGPALGIPSSRVGQIASTQFPASRWCPGTYRVTVALAGSRPFSTASFTVEP